MDQGYDVVVIGGGIVGLATAVRLTQEHPRSRVAVLEKEPEVGRHQAGHNSGVMHAGIYYAPGSQKANLCSTGAKMLRRYCDERSIEYDICGKVIVATDETELAGLEELHRRGSANGAKGLEVIGAERLRELEPHAAGIKAIYSPNTGVIDYDKVTAAFAVDIRENGGEVFTDTEVLRAFMREGRIHLETTGGDVVAGHVINSAGLQADKVARTMGVETGLRIVPFRGEFFSLRLELSSMVNGLIYPVPRPELPFLGVHVARRSDGSVEAGPNAVLAFAREGYRKTQVDLAEVLGILSYPGFWRMSMVHWKTGIREQYRSWIKRAFVRSVRVLVPEVRSNDLRPAHAGVRAQAVDRNGQLLQDFSIVQTEDSIHVLNAPSPAATSCLAIGQYIANLARKSFDLAA